MPLEPLPLCRFEAGPDSPEGDTARDELRGVKVLEVRYDKSCAGVDIPALRGLYPCA